MLGAWWIIQKRAARRTYSVFENLPYARFEDGDDTPARYTNESKSILHKGYVQVVAPLTLMVLQWQQIEMRI